MADKFRGQDFYQIRTKLLAEGKLFEDEVFPANSSSISFKPITALLQPFQWQRPDLQQNPNFFVDGSSRFDVQQGELGDCWLLAGLANLTLYDKLFAQVVPDDQGFGENYAGIFHFRFWQFGRWLDVVVDDRLPFRDGKLVVVHSATRNEFWSALLEKAYAKLNGSYEALDGGLTSEALEDFTGGLTEIFDMKSAPSNFETIMLQADWRSSLMGAAILTTSGIVELEEITANGLVKDHAYSITRIRYVHRETPDEFGKILLVRLRNPWGNDVEWKGPWSDGSKEWQFIPESEEKKIKLTFKEDGEFWMAFSDFKKIFTTVEICHLSPNTFIGEETADENMHRWEIKTFDAEWVRGSTAGGCLRNKETFWRNPQFVVKAVDADEDNDDNKCTLIVALTQKNRRSQRSRGKNNISIGLALFKLPDRDELPKPLLPKYLTEDMLQASVSKPPEPFANFICPREVVCRYEVDLGKYAIVPYSINPGEEAEFLLRVFTKKNTEMIKHDADLRQGLVDKRITLGQKMSEIEENKTKEMENLFVRVAGDDKVVDWRELKEVLDDAMESVRRSGKSRKPKEIRVTFSKDVCRSMISLKDKDQTGTLNFEEFKHLWTEIKKLAAAFRLYDVDDSKSLNSFELRDALDSAGYKLNSDILNLLVRRYSTKVGEIALDDFIMCTIKLRNTIDIFKKRDPKGQNVSFNIDEWIEKTMY